jgi:hypothetical protein
VNPQKYLDAGGKILFLLWSRWSFSQSCGFLLTVYHEEAFSNAVICEINLAY